ncbi:hypothetical protein EW026_g1016 [Hermanssonia centrifuga]|uniref:HMG box domain-containing protein n=1 Tax=Hermanssonia centrifuga TaxID=98765 RepID=A0A4S4KSW4_9APHY|nr:hypothetical protein EW026_g1016 [Hermanssonia centrifuga]
MQLMGSLGAVAETMRNCASFAEQFAQLIAQVPYQQNHPGFIPPNAPVMQLPAPPAQTPTGGKRKGRAEDGDDGKKKRKTKEKDPNAPKRPASSYLLFQNEVRQELKAQHPGLPNNELLNKIAKAWSEMPKEQKDTYEVRQKVAKNLYLVNKAAYENTLKGTDEASPPAQLPVIPPVKEIAAAPAPVVSSSSGSSASSDSDSSGDSDDENNSDEDSHPPVKKVKTETLKPKTEPVKDKKSKKQKA